MAPGGTWHPARTRTRLPVGTEIMPRRVDSRGCTSRLDGMSPSGTAGVRTGATAGLRAGRDGNWPRCGPEDRHLVEAAVVLLESRVDGQRGGDDHAGKRL